MTSRLQSHKWQQLRMQVLRANPLCVTCKAASHTRLAIEVDHIVPLIHGGSNGIDNLQGLCKACHEDKTASDMGYRAKVTTGADGWPVGGGAAFFFRKRFLPERP